ncbi:isopeptide-forming domain-containing fimbrial protein [Streptomyces sp. NPDC087440]|uniref:DUF7927 domain-containing protein n=1 Tax=Streptomyces sp. NPDC087440 TaxID=3365790 RepID=UPI00380A40BB
MVTVGVATLMSAVNAPAFAADQPAPGGKRAVFADTIDFGEPPTASLSDFNKGRFPCGGYINQGPSTQEVIATWSGGSGFWGGGACPANSVAPGTQSGIGFKTAVNQVEEVEKEFQMAEVSRYNNVITGGGSNPETTGKLHFFLQRKDVVCTWKVIETDNRPGDVPDPVTIDCGGTIEPFTSANGKKYELDLRGFREGVRDPSGKVTCQSTNPLIQTWQTEERTTTGACLYARLVGVPQQLEVKKTVDKATAQYGDVVTYTVTGTNTGTAPLNPATITDDMTRVMDAAEITGVQSATIDGQPADPPTYDAATKKLTWSGNLAVGQKVEITYRVRTKKLAGTDNELDNVITAPDSNCANGSAAECKTNTKITEVPLKVKKSVSRTTAEAGDTVTYTVEVENPGNARGEVEVVDDMTQVLDAADYTGTSGAKVNGTDTVAATFDASAKKLTWKGPLAAGAKLVLTYDVKIKNPLAGDKKLDNVVKVEGSNCEAGTAPECKTQVTTIETPLKVKKVVDRTTAESDDIVKYTVEVENPGADRLSVTVTDDLSKVLDAADFDGTPSATVDGAPAGTAAFDAAGQKLTWTGPLARGKKLLLTYQVKVKNPASGDKLLDNKISVPDSNCVAGSADPLCQTNVRIVEQPLKVRKTVGQKVAGSRNVVEYTIVVENPGAARNPVTVTDDLTEVLDAATFRAPATATVNGAPAAAPVYDAATKKLTWTGPLARNDKLEITYRVRTPLVAAGDKQLDNGVVVPGSNCETTADAACRTSVPVADLTTAKAGRPRTPKVGQTYTFEITVTNTGKVDLVGAAAAKVVDDLTDVVDDAVYNNNARVTSGPAGRLTYSAAGKSLTWQGDLRVNESVKIVYTVTVRRQNRGGNNFVNNVQGSGYDLATLRSLRRAVDDDDEAGKDIGHCETGDPTCSAGGGIAYLDTAKTASPAKVKQGEKVTYTWSLKNTGKAEVEGDPDFDYVVDPIPGVLKYADYNNDIKVVEGPGSVSFAEGRLKWTGPLKIGEKAVVTFSVTVRKDALKGLPKGKGAMMGNTVNTEYNCWPGDPNEPPEKVCSATVEIVPPVPPKPDPCSHKPGAKNPCKPVKPVKPCSHKPGAKNPCKKPGGHKPRHTAMGGTGQLAETGGDTDSLLAIGGVSGLLLLGGGLTLVAARRRNH